MPSRLLRVAEDQLNKMDFAATNNNPIPGHDIFYTPHNEAFYAEASYEELDPMKQEIRLLRLLPAQGENMIECEMTAKVGLEEVRGKYAALSYCAGDPESTHEILVNGVPFNVFANLHHALSEVQNFWAKNRAGKDCLLWVDQICTNQQNLLERSHQEGTMRKIYGYAEQVLISLATRPDTGRGINWLLKMHRRLLVMPDLVAALPDYSKQRLCRENILNYLNNHMHSKTFKQDWILMLKMLESQWWKRAWVYQEFISSACSYFLCGNESISWKVLASILGLYFHPFPTYTGRPLYRAFNRIF